MNAKQTKILATYTGQADQEGKTGASVERAARALLSLGGPADGTYYCTPQRVNALACYYTGTPHAEAALASLRLKPEQLEAIK